MARCDYTMSGTNMLLHSLPLDIGSHITKKFVMSAKTDQLEIDVARWINRTSENVVATRPKASTAFSDIWLSKVGFDPCWLEVKSSHEDNLINPRVYYDKIWRTTYTQYSAQYTANLLNMTWESKQFIRTLAQFSDIPIEELKLPTNKKNLPGTVPIDTLKEFFDVVVPNRYIISLPGHDIASVITKDYNERGVFYMQAADDFYMLGHTNPLRLPEDIPMIEGRGDFKVRVSTRSAFCEIQAELKFDELPSSQYSCKPGTEKLNPLQ